MVEWSKPRDAPITRRWYHEYPMALRIAAVAVIIGWLGMTVALYVQFESFFVSMLFFLVAAIIAATLVKKDVDHRAQVERAHELSKAKDGGKTGSGPVRIRRGQPDDQTE